MRAPPPPSVLVLLGLGAAMLAAHPARSFAAAQASAPVAASLPGEALAFDRTKGNCLACHTLPGSDVPSNVGPALIHMQARFPDRATLYAILYDEARRNPQTVMPPFGQNRILTPAEINQIIDYLDTL